MAESTPQENRLRAALGPGQGCLSAQELELYVDGKAPSGLSEHLAGCAHCRAELDLFRSFHEPVRNAAEAEAVERIVDRLESPRMVRPATVYRPWWRLRWPGAAIAGVAAALLVTAVGIEVRRQSAPAIVALPGEDVMRSGAIAVVSPLGDVPDVPSQIQWQPVAGAERYEVGLLEVDRVALWNGTTSETRIDLPAEAKSRIVPLKTLLVQVRAFDRTGKLVAQSGLERFRLLQNVYTH